MRPCAGLTQPERIAATATASTVPTVPSATAVSWVGDLGEAVEQVMALVGVQRGGRGQPLDNSRNGRDEQAGTVLRRGHGP
jgi:hypothetical protein